MANPEREKRDRAGRVHGAELTERIVSVFPAVQHRHPDGTIVTVVLRRKDGGYQADCPGCHTRFVYQKPAPSRRIHHRSPLLPEIKGNFDGSDE